MYASNVCQNILKKLNTHAYDALILTVLDVTINNKNVINVMKVIVN